MPTLLPSLRSVVKFALGSAQVAFIQNGEFVRGGAPLSCPAGGQLSCQNTTAVADTCCFNAPGGLFLQTQFWDTAPSTGPSNHWTVHGLWPDNCDGTYQSFCDASRQYTGIASTLQANGQTALLDYMKIYWKDANGNDESFWEHEWGKHGTCISTLDTKCYTGYTPEEELIDYLNITVSLFKQLDSYAFLSAANILPSSSLTYTSSAILAALTTPRGATPIIRCTSGALNEIWYFYEVRGSVQTGQFVPENPAGATSNCPASGVKYLPKSGTPVPTTPVSPPPPAPTSTSTAAPPPPAPTGTGTPGAPFTGKGYLMVTSGGQTNGCIISGGTWYTTGTCATFTAAASGSGSSLTSSKGPCTILNGQLSCAPSNAVGVFENLAGNVGVAGSDAFYATSAPTGSLQARVYTSVHATGLTIQWKAI